MIVYDDVYCGVFNFVVIVSEVFDGRVDVVVLEVVYYVGSEVVS